MADKQISEGVPPTFAEEEEFPTTIDALAAIQTGKSTLERRMRALRTAGRVVAASLIGGVLGLSGALVGLESTGMTHFRQNLGLIEKPAAATAPAVATEAAGGPTVQIGPTTEEVVKTEAAVPAVPVTPEAAAVTEEAAEATSGPAPAAEVTPVATEEGVVAATQDELAATEAAATAAAVTPAAIPSVESTAAVVEAINLWQTPKQVYDLYKTKAETPEQAERLFGAAVFGFAAYETSGTAVNSRVIVNI